MKLSFILFIITFCSMSLCAQVPQKMSYQAIIRDAENALVKGQSVGMQISIVQGSADGTIVYSETHNPTSNTNGLISIEIGTGTTTDDFTTIDWSNGPYFVKTETDLEGGSNYTITGTSQLLSVPFAMHTNTAERIIGTIAKTDPVYAAIIDSARQIRADIPDVSGFITSESDPSVPTGTQTGQIQYWDGTAWATVEAGSEGQILSINGGVPTWVKAYEVKTGRETDVYNPITGQVWMDRNLGASQVATSSNDAAAYGDLYQWGRATDGHEKRTSGTTTTLSTTDTPGHGDYILISSGSYDWRNPQNDNLWQGVNGANNPCPGGYRLPTEAEWEAERQSWSSSTISGAFASPLKLPAAGLRFYIEGTFENVGSSGYYWSSTVNSIYSRGLQNNYGAQMATWPRATAKSVRCIKDY